MESILSSIPPWPGKIEPESLVLLALFTIDSVRSPHIPIRQIKVVSTTIGALGFAGIFYGQKHPWVRVPQTHAVHGTVQRQLRPRDFITVLSICRYGFFLTCCWFWFLLRHALTPDDYVFFYAFYIRHLWKILAQKRCSNVYLPT